MKTVTLLLFLPLCQAAALAPATERAWHAYTAQVEQRICQQHARLETYLATLSCDAQKRANINSQLLSGSVLIAPVNGGPRTLDSAFVHHWRAAAYVSGSTAAAMLHLLRDYDHLSRYYAPVVISSHLLAVDGGAATIRMRMSQKKLITVVLDSEFRVESALDGNDRGYEFSRSTHIWQVDYPGTVREQRLPEREGDGLLWRLNSYWSFIQWREGLVIECESLSLTRDVPVGLSWLITPIIRDLPRESLEFTIRATEKALRTQEMKGAQR